MTSPRLTIPVTGPSAATLDLLLIEQQEWSAYTGVVTSSRMVRALRTMLYGDEYQETLNCGVVDGNVVCAVYVYPRQRGLDYQFAASYGNLSDRSEEDVVEEETLNFSLATSVTPTHPPLEVIAASWVADVVYDVAGNRIAAPALMIDGQNIVADTGGMKIYGSVAVRYRTERHAYTLTVPRRDDAVDNFYSAVVYGWYEGGLNWEEIEMPPGIEVFEADAAAVCGSSGGSASIPEDDDDGPYDQPVTANRRTTVDYCFQEIIEDSYV